MIYLLYMSIPTLCPSKGPFAGRLAPLSALEDASKSIGDVIGDVIKTYQVDYQNIRCSVRGICSCCSEIVDVSYYVGFASQLH